MSAVIFDLDGVLIDSEHNYLLAEREVLTRYGIDFTAELKRPYIGMSTRDIFVGLTAQFPISDPVETLVAGKNAAYLRIAADRTVVFGPTRRLVELLAARSTPLAVASGTSPEVISAVLAWTGLDGYFRSTVSAESVPRGKPYPDLFVEAADQLGVDPGECVVVEDSRHGVLAAQRAGMRCVALPATRSDEPAEVRAGLDLLVPGGAARMDPDAVFAWICGGTYG